MRALVGLSLSGVAAVAMTYLSEEIDPAVVAFSMGLYISGHLTRRCRRDPAALPLGACLGLAARLLVFLLLPLLILAALTEAYVTPLAAGLFL